MIDNYRESHKEYTCEGWKIGVHQNKNEDHPHNAFYVVMYKGFTPVTNANEATIHQLYSDIRRRIRKCIIGDGNTYHRWGNIIDIKLPAEWVQNTPSGVRIEIHLYRVNDIEGDMKRIEYFRHIADEIQPELNTLTQELNRLIDSYNCTDEELNKSSEQMQVLEWLFNSEEI